MKIDQLNGIIAFLAVAKKKSFTAAALDLGITPSAVSQAIKQLELRLGVALVSRTTRSVNLTEVGQQFLSRCNPGLEDVLTAIDEIGDLGQKPAGLLRIALSRPAFATVIQPKLGAFLKRYPDISVELSFNENFEDVVAGGFDAGIRLSETVEKDMVAVRIYPPFRFVVAGAPKYFEKVGRPQAPKDLLAHDCIRMRFAGGQMYERWEFEKNGKDINVTVAGRLIVNDPEKMKQAALDGLGLIYYLEPSISKEVSAGKLEIVLEAHAPKSEGYFLYFPSRAQMLPKLRAFVEFMK